MTKCSNRNQIQTKMNKGNLCKQCFNKKIIKFGSDVNNDVSNKNDDTNDTCDADRTIIDIIKENMVNEKE